MSNSSFSRFLKEYMYDICLGICAALAVFLQVPKIMRQFAGCKVIGDYLWFISKDLLIGILGFIALVILVKALKRLDWWLTR